MRRVFRTSFFRRFTSNTRIDIPKVNEFSFAFCRCERAKIQIHTVQLSTFLFSESCARPSICNYLVIVIVSIYLVIAINVEGKPNT